MAPDYLFHQMDDTDVGKISSWRYEPPYDWDADPNDLAELQDPRQRRDVYFSFRDRKGQFVGFFQFEQEDEVVDVGLGLRPDLTGMGLGLEFLLSGLKFAAVQAGPFCALRLDVQQARDQRLRAGRVPAGRGLHERD